MSRDDRVYLRHILDAIDRIDGYLSGMNYEEFCSHEMAQDAIIRQFEIIGEASKKPERYNTKRTAFSSLEGDGRDAR